MNEVRRATVKLGLDFRPIPVDLGDGIEWDFHPDPSSDQWATLVTALKSFTKFDDDDMGGPEFKEALDTFTVAMSELIVSSAQRKEWVKKKYGLGPQQAISQVLMELWTGFPTPPPSPSGTASKRTG